VHSGGRVASLLGAADVEHFSGRHVIATNVNATPTTAKMESLAALASSGELRVVVQGTYSIDQIGEALEAFRKGARRKLIVRV
jgi:NADPH:quinone reductase-like Zn-dependent oxidoreductase